MDKVKMDTGTAKDFSKEHVTGKRKKKRGNTRKEKIVGEFLSTSRDGTMPSLHLSEGHPNLLVGEKVISLNGLSTEIMLDEGIGHAEGRSAPSTCNAFTVKDAEVLCHRMAPFASVRRKLLVLDINGLLADIVFPAPKHCEGDIKVYGRAVFRRPFCDDFLKFCFQNFYVGIWSSRTKRIIDKVVSYLLGDQKDKLLFCWDMTHSTQTGFKTLENRHKPLVCKELRKIWEHDDPSWPWKKGDYNESNTLLLDDSPYKALLNPLHTAIFPHPYQYSDKNDNLLGPGGDLRVYLEGLVTSENVQKYVERHPFGQRPISEQNLSWEFYNQVINQMSNVEPRT
ncbi:Haloacid dehalogenase-like hydrolase superfamily protein [Perilla frutescens var. hirtella]|uniref:Mitochondrial import inner membrane translocase subunit TIM50 n=1 Tax=Perilla frutescens var. hirtella TaxID=608512 RepID=A0AAD4J9J8_PERFH|nr:Haloacid dehalogenase-like hydrolase superfamily protein [Perilla frutescens var. hirtella]